jgi:hypothetical protein
MMRKNQNFIQTIELIKTRNAVRRDFFNGITSYTDLANRHGISGATVTKYIKAIMREVVWEDNETGKEQFVLAERRLMSIYSKAVDAFERSRKNAEEISTQYIPKPCPDCKGVGFEGGDKSTERWCVTCDGDGKIMTEIVTKKVKGQAGDANFLRVQLDCIREINRIRGHYPKSYADGTNNTHLHLHQAPTMDLSNVPEDVLLKALEAMDQLKRPPQIDPLQIDVESKPSRRKKDDDE